MRSASGRVTGLEATQTGDSLRFEAPLVVVADGVGGFAGRGMKAHQNAVARRQYFSDGNPDQQDLHVFITEDMNSNGAGYGWVFYLGDGRANVGAGVSTASLARTGRNLKDFYDRFLEEPQLAAWLENATPEGPPTSWSLKMGMWGAKRYDQGLMAVGDAGSMVHPISGEGVGYALESGRLAASWANEAYVRKDFSASVLSGYERQLKRRRAREHLSGYALVKLVPNLMLLEPIQGLREGARSPQDAPGGFYRRLARLQPLKHPRMLTRALQDSVTQRIRS